MTMTDYERGRMDERKDVVKRLLDSALAFRKLVEFEHYSKAEFWEGVADQFEEEAGYIEKGDYL